MRISILNGFKAVAGILFLAMTVSSCKTPELRENVAPSNEMSIGISSTFNQIVTEDNGASMTLFIDGDSIKFSTYFILGWGVQQWVWIQPENPLNYEYITYMYPPVWPDIFNAEVFPDGLTFQNEIDSSRYRWALSFTTPIRILNNDVGIWNFPHGLFEYPYGENRYIIFRKNKAGSWLYFWVKLVYTNPAPNIHTISIISVNYQMDSIITGQ